MATENILNLDELESKLDLLTGNDFEEVESIERQLGNLTPMITFSSSFQARLAAHALGVTPQELRGLKLPEYNDVISRTSNFLFGTSAKRIQLKKSENLQ